jgi:hypothetical protein
MFRLITYTDQNGIPRHVYVQVVPGEGSVAKAINKLTQSGVPQENITERGSFASVADITSDSRFSDAQDIGSFTGATEQPSPGGGGGEGVSGVLNPIRGGADAEFGPQFRAGLADRGITLGGGGGLEGRLAGDARSPFFSRSLASAAFADPAATRDNALPSFQEMVRTGDLFGAGAGQQARDLLRQAQGFGTNFTGRGALAGSILNPETVDEGNDLANIAREAGRQRFGSFNRFTPQAGALSEQFFAQPAATASTFADFLNQKIFGGG